MIRIRNAPLITENTPLQILKRRRRTHRHERWDLSGWLILLLFIGLASYVVFHLAYILLAEAWPLKSDGFP